MRTLRTATRLAMILGLVVAGSAWVPVDDSRSEEVDVYSMEFPVDGAHSFTNSYGAPRDGARVHLGIDIFADKLTPVVAVADGTVRKIATGDRAGRYIVLDHADGWVSLYLHLNNDTPGTDDGLYDEPVPGIAVGATVKAGDLLDYVGDSGNAETTSSHLHFELHRPDGDAVSPYPHLLAASGALPGQIGVAKVIASASAPTMSAVEVVGHYDPGDGFAAGVWVHDEVAYLGTWGRPTACPSPGIRVIDVADPTEPRQIGVLATGEMFPGTDTDSVWVGSLETTEYRGDIAVVAVSLCDNREANRGSQDFRGLAVYDVADPSAPNLLSTIHTGEQTQGIHELDVTVREDGGVLVAATVMQSYPHTAGARGDVRLYDVTDPTLPAETADWDFRRDMPSADATELMRGVDPDEFHAHSVAFSAAGQCLWVASWDGGAVLLDVADPATPIPTKWVQQYASEEGNVHSVLSDAERGLVILSSEDLYPDDEEGHASGWGYVSIFDLTGRRLADWVAGALAATPSVPRNGYHTAHNAELIGQILYSSWYSSGLRIIDLADPGDPVEVGYFIPPKAPDPLGYWEAPDGSRSFAMVWDVHVVDDLVYVSDMNTGLWIVRYVAGAPSAPDAR